jgi:glycosyltransferase involved in cell wall biosynthesis
VKIAFVIQRYGTEVLGGAEHLCRLIAERLATQHDVEVLTTCARDYITWKNEYPEGSDRIRGVTVRRFANAQARDIDAFNKYSEWIYTHSHSRNDEMEWLKQQGPWSPALIEHLRRQQQQFDVLVFFTYLYAPTVLGLEIAPSRSVLVPTAHDEPAIQLGIFKEMFNRPAAMIYNTDSEQRFVKSMFPNRPLLEEVAGVGVDLPQHNPYPRMPDPPDEDGEAAEENESAGTSVFPPHLTARGAVFRRRHRLHGPILLYGGRIDPGKGCEELIEYFNTYVSDGGDATLALMGVKLMSLPEDPHVRFAGLLSERERLQALEAATVVVCPSPYESLSLLALEGLSVGTPILVNARSEVLVDHCVRSNGGLYYSNRDEFVECL